MYPYTPLPTPTSIRLLTLNDEVNESHLYSLQTFRLDDAPPFNALSYTWHNPQSPFSASYEEAVALHAQSASLLCDGSLMHIKPNLKHALRAVLAHQRRAPGEGRLRYLWVDAICIDQENLQERGQQVSIMGEIYKAAVTVIAWLGQEDEFMPHAFKVLRTLSAFPETQYHALSQNDFHNQELCARVLGVSLSQEDWLGWVAFLHRPYFQRIWIVQEVAVAKRVVFICGPFVFNPEELFAAIKFLAKVNWISLLHIEYMRRCVIVGSPDMFQKLLQTNIDPGYCAAGLTKLRYFTISGQAYGLLAAARIFRGSQASDPRDKIYALLGFVKKFSNPIGGDQGVILPSYDVSVQSLYTRVTKIMIATTGQLNILSQIEPRSPDGVGSLPSWVPDYSVPILPEALYTKARDIQWSACGNLTWRPEGHDYDNALLNAHGKCIASIEGTSLVAARESDDDHVWASVYAVTEGIPDYSITSVDSSVRQLQTRIEVLWRTLLADTYLGQHPAPAQCGQQFMSHVSSSIFRIHHELEKQESKPAAHFSRNPLKRLIRRFRTPNDETPEICEDPRTQPVLQIIDIEPKDSPYNDVAFLNVATALVERGNDPSIKTLAEYRSPWQTLRVEMNKCIALRRVIRTDNGLLGLGPASTEVGDQVWILAGAKTPIVLRPHGDGLFSLVGEAYIHGIMHGQAMDAEQDLDEITIF